MSGKHARLEHFEMCFYASVLDLHLDKAVELLADITFHSTFPSPQIDKERMVILEEMSMYLDTPEDAIQDEFDEILFHNHQLGKNILGNRDTVNNFQQADFLNFLSRNLHTERIIISSVGNYSLKKLMRMVDKHIAPIPYKSHSNPRNFFKDYTPSSKEVNKTISQSHMAIGTEAFNIHNKERIPFFLLTNILGGPGMNSRLNLSLREKHGYVYGVDASFSSYIDTGVFSIFFATDPKNLKKSVSLIKKEIEILKKKPLGQIQLHKAKQQLK
ncbi:MAG: pitrilysin family protein, partial [Cyclobacteriaceae bacterium]